VGGGSLGEGALSRGVSGSGGVSVGEGFQGEGVLSRGESGSGGVSVGGGFQGDGLPIRRETQPGGAPVGGGSQAEGGPNGGESRAEGIPRSGEFRRDGAVWSLSFAGRSAHLPDAKGLRDLRTLLSLPGQDVPAVRLLAPDGGELVVAARRMGGDEVLDEEAKTRYRRRLTLLDEEIDRAVELGEDRRAAEFDRERAALLEELRSAAGLGGRTRRLGDEAERARKTVTARIRDILRKLDHAHPELATHLRASISTGSTCRYQPESETTWRL
jgi:hypothetical protein